jgi:hypothetical protein
MNQTYKAPALGCRPLRATATTTGAHCPVTGWWNPAGHPGHGQAFFEGNLMPPFADAPVIWVLAPESDGH